MNPSMLAYMQLINQADPQRFSQMIGGGSQMMDSSADLSPPPPIQQPQPSPLQAGIVAGRKSARESLEMDEDEKRKAFGMAILQIGAGLGRTGYGPGLAGRLNAINQSINPAVQAYQAEADRVAAEKAWLMENQNKEMKIFQDTQNQEALQQHRREQNENVQKYREGQLSLGKEKIKSSEKMAEKRLAQKQKMHLDKLNKEAEKVKESNEYHKSLMKKWSLEYEKIRSTMIQNELKNLSPLDPNYEKNKEDIAKKVDERLEPYREINQMGGSTPFSPEPQSSISKAQRPLEEESTGYEHTADDEFNRLLDEARTQ